MTTFEFIAVLLSIIFGLGLTNLLSGLPRAFVSRELTDTRLAWTVVAGTLLVGDWWQLFRWSDHTEWRFHEFLFLVFWAIAHYLMAVALFPNKLASDYSDELREKFVLWSALALTFFDAGENFIRESLFDPAYYPLKILLLVVLISLPLLIPKPAVMRLCGWILAVSMLAWSIVVRNVLGT